MSRRKVSAMELESLVAVVISITAVVVSVVVASRQERLARNASNALVAIELLDRERRSDEFLESEDFIVNVLSGQYGAERGVSGLPFEARRHVSRIGLFYNNLGQMLAVRAVNRTLLFSTASYRSRQAWLILRPFIEEERRLRNDRYLSHFEHFAYLAGRPETRKAVAKLKLHSFPPGYPYEAWRITTTQKKGAGDAGS
jgi:hypothetical protein